ncbi:MAG: EF-P lysine aminoacylase GenX [Desulfotignum sp.]|nr:EF-P lysine aminoacylase GenX [Desulfotignum sp.]MCF8112834.1 EF-P lysine aminoacylase GenX [Desulfotignum sp.]MCF8125271.1 EF-P lysine aminoacylase GenX [Desulfotignum sp.]
MDQAIPPSSHGRHLETRAGVIRLIREFFWLHRYLEVETPVKSPAVIPEAHIDLFMAEEHFLTASPELYMKRLLARGYPKIFQICKCFRKNERGCFHLPEMTLLEWYGAGDTYLDLMDQCQALVRHIAAGLNCGDFLSYQGMTLDLAQPFKRLTVHQAFEAHAGRSCDQALDEGSFHEIMGFDIEPCLGQKQPVFLMDYPRSLASLAALHPKNPTLAQRCEFYMAGIELANGFTELTDAAVQRRRFDMENQIRISQGLSVLPLPETFLSELDALPECAGIALGVDRLVMLFANASCIDQVVAFTPEIC